MMGLKVRDGRRRIGRIDHLPSFPSRRLFAVRDRGIPRTCVPGPFNVLGAQAVADGGSGLRRQGGRVRRVGVETARSSPAAGALPLG